jgi:hypothetical protein
MSGLSNAGFMGGLMQGSRFVEGIQNRADVNKRAGESHEQQTKLNDLKINEAEQKVLLGDLERDLRSMEETNKTLTKDQWKKYKTLGLDKLGNDAWREENKDAGALIHRGMTTGEWDEKSLDGFNTSFYDELRSREKLDGLTRKIVGVQETKDGRMAAILEVTKKDGSKHRAPLTKNGTADDDDTLVVFDDKKLQEIYEVQMHRADMAYAVDQAGGDPKKLAAVMRKIVFKQAPKEAPGLESVYDQRTGRDQKVVWNGSKYVPIGGNKVEYEKGSKGSGSGGSSEDFSKVLKEYRDKMTAAQKEGDPALVDSVNENFYNTEGIQFEIVQRVIESKARRGDLTPPTREEVLVASSGNDAGGRSRAVEEVIAQNPGLYGTPTQPTEEEIASRKAQEEKSFLAAGGSLEPVKQEQGLAQANVPPQPNNQPTQQTAQPVDPFQSIDALQEQLNQLDKTAGNRMVDPQRMAQSLELRKSMSLARQQVEVFKEEAKRPLIDELNRFGSSVRSRSANSNNKVAQAIRQAISAIDSALSKEEIERAIAAATITKADSIQGLAQTAHL